MPGDMDAATVWLPMLAAIVTGAAIGLEREVKAKSAGVRTHALVCFSACLLTMAGARQADWIFDALPGTNVVSDPARMAHGIVTGIGFLGAGVIFRQGNAVRGLTTAASIWMTAALGVLYGAGLLALAVAGSATTLVVLILFRLLHRMVPDRLTVRIAVVCAGTGVAEVTGVIARLAVRAGPCVIRRDVEAGVVEVVCTAWLRQAAGVEGVDAALSALPGVRQITITPEGEET